MMWWQWVLVIFGGIFYLFGAGMFAYVANKSVNEYAQDARRARTLLDRSPLMIEARKAAAQKHLKYSTRQARLALAVLWTCYLWPLWLFILAIAGLIDALSKATKAVRDIG